MIEMRQLLNRVLPAVLLAAIPMAAWAADKVVTAASHCCCPICCP